MIKPSETIRLRKRALKYRRLLKKLYSKVMEDNSGADWFYNIRREVEKELGIKSPYGDDCE